MMLFRFCLTLWVSESQKFFFAITTFGRHVEINLKLIHMDWLKTGRFFENPLVGRHVENSLKESLHGLDPNEVRFFNVAISWGQKQCWECFKSSNCRWAPCRECELKKGSSLGIWRKAQVFLNGHSSFVFILGTVGEEGYHLRL